MCATGYAYVMVTGRATLHDSAGDSEGDEQFHNSELRFLPDIFSPCRVKHLIKRLVKLCGIE